MHPIHIMAWTESDAAHKLIRRKNAKAKDISRRKARQSKTSRSKMNAEGMEMTPDIENYPGLPVVPDSYGTNSALTSGQGVPQWYGSAEHHMTLSDLSDTPFGAFVKPDGTVIMVISDKSVKGKEQEAIDWGLNHFGKQYEGVKFVKYSSEYDAESRFDNLADKIAKQYEKKGMNPQEAREVGKKTAYKIGAGKYGKAGMAAKSRAGRMAAESSDDIRTAADLVAWADSNEGNLPLMSTMNATGDNEYLSMIDSDDDEIDFVFLDGTMATCLLDGQTLSTFVIAYESETFEARARYDPSENDVLETKEKFQLTFPSFEMSPSSLQYLTFQQGSSNKFHTFWLAQDSSGGWYAFNAYQSLGYSPNIFRITGPTSQEQAARAMQSKMNAKLRKGYSNRSKEFGLRAEMITEGLPVIPDSYGTNSALSSGQGVPVWYGSADTEDEDWDRMEYEYKEVELAKPFRTAFMASLGFIVAPLVALTGLAFVLGDE